MITTQDREKIHPSLRSQIIEVQGNPLHVVQAGPEDGPIVLLLHGFPEFWYGWRHQIGWFAEAGYTVWAPDQRGYNLSGKPQGVAQYSMDALVGDVIGLIEVSGRAEVNLIGHDWGAAVAWGTAANYASRVRRLGILNVPHPAALRAALRESWSQRFKSWYIAFFQIHWLPEMVLSILGPGWLLRGSSKSDTFTVDELQRYKQAWSQKGALTGMLAWYRAAFRDVNSSFKTGRVAMPTLILWGDRDIALDKRTEDNSLRWCKQGRIIHYPDATHWLQHDKADAVNRELLEFIQPKGQ
jgi:pimeloyl-ACP methyl ester carboxylesterase